MSWADYSTAPKPDTLICAEAEVDSVLSVEIKVPLGTFPILLVRRPEGLRAYVNACPHQYLPLDCRGPNILSADGDHLMCTAHGARFKAEDGAVISGADDALDPIPIEVRDGAVFVAA